MARTLGINRKQHSKPVERNVVPNPDPNASDSREDTRLESVSEIAGSERESESSDTWKSTDDTGIVDPASIGDGTNSGSGSDTGTRRRGRPRGSTNGNNSGRKSGRKSASQTSENLEKILFSIHFMAASHFQIEELALAPEEASNLAAAVNAVTECYDVPLLSEKAQAWIALSICAGTIYAPRIVAMKTNAKKKPRPHLVSQQAVM